MEKPYQIQNQEGMYFLTFSVHQWIDIFTRQACRDIVVDSLKYCQKEKGLLVHAWCIMSNHLHLILSVNGTQHLSEVLRDFKKFTAKQILSFVEKENESRKNWMLWLFRAAGKSNPRNKKYQFWQQDNHAIELISNQFMEQKLEYVHNNPVVAGIVEVPAHYIYSSARDYTGTKGLIEITFIE